jgi:hypothetical protein
MKMNKTEDYQAPLGPCIPSGEETEELYRLEEEQGEALRQAAIELGRVLGYRSTQLWTHTYPEALLTVLEGHDTRASELAAIVYLRKRGYTVGPGEKGGYTQDDERVLRLGKVAEVMGS